MDMDEIAQGERECLRGQVAKLQQRVTELQRENAELRDSLDAAMRLADAAGAVICYSSTCITHQGGAAWLPQLLR